MPFSSCYLFSRLSDPQLERVQAISREQKMLLTVVDERIEIPIAMIKTQNGCIGIGALVPPFRYSLSARAALESNLLVFNRTDLETLKHDDPGLVCIIMNNLAQKLLDRLKETRREMKVHFMNLVRSATF
jgi:hypothetical protein